MWSLQRQTVKRPPPWDELRLFFLFGVIRPPSLVLSKLSPGGRGDVGVFIETLAAASVSGGTSMYSVTTAETTSTGAELIEALKT